MNKKTRTAKKAKELPPLYPLPHGEDSFSYLQDSNIKNNIHLRKRINGKYVDIYGDFTQAVTTLLQIKFQ